MKDRPPALDARVVAAALADLPAWTGDTSGITRTHRSTSMSDAADSIVEIASAADEMDHHPDIDLRYRTIHIRLATHDAGAVTDLDLQLAREIDEILDGPPGPPSPALQAALDQIDRQFGRGRHSGPPHPGSGA